MNTDLKFLTILILSMAIICPKESQAQYVFATDDPNIGQVTTQWDYERLDKNAVFLKQAGHQNRAFVSQKAGLKGDNFAEINQRGAFQHLTMTQQGSSNKANLRQLGMNNVLGITQSGTSIRTNVFQIGHGNSFHNDIVGDNLNYSVLQFGNNWGMTIVGSSNLPGLKVEQTGMAGTPVTIQHH